MNRIGRINRFLETMTLPVVAQGGCFLAIISLPGWAALVVLEEKIDEYYARQEAAAVATPHFQKCVGEVGHRNNTAVVKCMNRDLKKTIFIAYGKPDGSVLVRPQYGYSYEPWRRGVTCHDKITLECG